MQITWKEKEKNQFKEIISTAVKSLDTVLDQSGQIFIDPFGSRKTFIFPNNDKSTYIKDFLNVMEENSDYKKIATNNLISKNEVTTLLIKIVAKQYKDIIELVEFFIEQLNDLIKVDLVCIIPNYVLVFDDEVEHFTFGDSLKCIKSENLESEYAENKIKIVTDYPSRDYTEGIPVLISPDANYSDLVHRLPTKYCFCVNIKKCSPSMAYDIARWHVDTAISLARLYGVLNSDSIRDFDSIVERSAYTYNRNTDNASLIMNNTGSVYAISTHKTQKFYEIKSTTKDTIGKTNFIDACNKIYNAKQKLSVYERIERALGWMTKARTSIDIATKFLLFFTALEALMPEIKTHTICTKNKKCSKVDAVCTKTEECKEQKVGISENLARCIATIFSATPTERKNLYKEVKKCYSIRSLLVHSGGLNVSEEDCKKLETYTEYVCYWFLEYAIKSGKSYEVIITKLANAWDKEVFIVTEIHIPTFHFNKRSNSSSKAS